MRSLTEREKRTIRFAGVAIVIYLALFFGLRTWRALEGRRAEYQQLLTDARRLKRDLQPFENRVLLAEKLRESFNLDLTKLSKATLVADASAAIQKAAAAGKIQLGPVRESPGRASAKEMTTIQLEGTGPVAGAMSLLHRITTLGYPVVIDSVQVTPEKPGMVKMSLTIVILDFEHWTKGGGPHA